MQFFQKNKITIEMGEIKVKWGKLTIMILVAMAVVVEKQYLLKSWIFIFIKQGIIKTKINSTFPTLLGSLSIASLLRDSSNFFTIVSERYF